MTKRVCSDEYGFFPQLKKHIKEKDVYSTVYHKAIHRKTIDLLFKGANHIPKEEGSKIQTAKADTSQITTNGRKDRFKQCSLSNQCQLITDVVLQKEAMQRCCLDSNLSCYFCEKNCCDACLIDCESCKQNFCKNCAFLNFGSKNRSLCLSCYSSA